MSDEDVVCAVLDGNHGLYEVLVRRHNQKVYRAVRSVLREDGEVEDVMQQAYLSAYIHLAQFRGSAMFSTWLVRIAVHEAHARLRHGRRLIEKVDEMAREVDDCIGGASPDDPERRAGARELGAVLEGLVSDLPTHFRTVFVLREVEGMSTAEVGAALDLSEDNVKTRLRRAKIHLRDGLVRRLGPESVRIWRFEAPRCDRVATHVMTGIADLRGRG